MSVIEEDTNLAVDLYAPIVMPSPPPTFNPLVIAHAIGSFYDVKNGDGTGVWNGRRASLIPTIAGVIRYGEPTTTPDIPHALSVIMAQSVMKNAAVWPAYGYDTSNSYGNCATCLPMGALLAIPATTDLTTLGISTQEGMVIVRAAQKYGVYIVDTAIDPQNSPAMFFEAQLNNPDTGLQAMATPGSAGGYDLTIIAKNLQLVTNNSAQNPGGPGTHTSMAPPFSD
jgi:hypothetical protein